MYFIKKFKVFSKINFCNYLLYVCIYFIFKYLIHNVSNIQCFLENLAIVPVNQSTQICVYILIHFYTPVRMGLITSETLSFNLISPLSDF